MPMSKTKELFGTFFKIGAFTFGGGYAMVALLEHEFVEEKRWLTREEFLDMVAIAESTPGPVAVNSATYRAAHHSRQHHRHHCRVEGGALQIFEHLDPGG